MYIELAHLNYTSTVFDVYVCV